MAHQLLKDGKVIFTSKEHSEDDKEYNECLEELHKVQPHSWDYALKHGGYQIIKQD